MRLDHAAKHESLRAPPSRINTRSSHLSLWFSRISGMNILRFSTFSSTCSGSSLSLTYDSELWSQAQLSSKIYSERPGLGPLGWWKNWITHVGASVLWGLGFLPSWSCSGACVMLQFLFRLHFIIHPSPLSSVPYWKCLGGSIQRLCDGGCGYWVQNQIPCLELLTSCNMQCFHMQNQIYIKKVGAVVMATKAEWV